MIGQYLQKNPEEMLYVFIVGAASEDDGLYKKYLLPQSKFFNQQNIFDSAKVKKAIYLRNKEQNLIAVVKESGNGSQYQ